MFVMFDLDNTLADRAGAVTAWIDEFVADRGLQPTERQWLWALDNDGYSERGEVFRQIKDRYRLSDPVEQLLAAYRKRVVELTTTCPGATACLQRFRDHGAVLAIVTNGGAAQQQAKIERLELAPLVDSVIISGVLGVAKPDRRIFDAAADACEMTLPGAWMIGDSAANDIVGPAALQMTTGWLHRGRSWDRSWDRSDVSPDLTLDGLADLQPATVDAYLAER